MGYCPKCGAEYLPGFERCADCDVDLVDEPSASVGVVPDRVHLIDVFSTGRRVDAELVRSMLEGHGLTAHLWAAGMGPWRMESALTEVTGVASAFNSYRVMVPSNQVEDAETLIADVEVEGDYFDPGSSQGLMGIMRSRWVLVGAALSLLAMVALFGPRTTSRSRGPGATSSSATRCLERDDQEGGGRVAGGDADSLERMRRWWWVPAVVGLLVALALMGPLRAYERISISPGYCPWFAIQYLVADPSRNPGDPSKDDVCEDAAADRVPWAAGFLLAGLAGSALIRKDGVTRL